MLIPLNSEVELFCEYNYERVLGSFDTGSGDYLNRSSLRYYYSNADKFRKLIIILEAQPPGTQYTRLEPGRLSLAARHY